MNLYMWRSEALKQYGLGWIIVPATADLESSRRHARKSAEAYYWAYYDWRDPADPDDAEQFREWTAKLDRDLASTPEEQSSLFIQGSE